jgi:hypothetical protein
MLYISLVLSAILLVVANLAVHRSRHPIWIIVLSSVGLGFGPIFFLVSFYPGVAALGLLLTLSVVVWRYSGRNPSSYLLLSGVASVFVCGVIGWIVLAEQRRYARLRERFPYESMEARIPPPRHSAREKTLPGVFGKQWLSLEKRIEDEGRSFRNHQLTQLHEHAVSLFINSPGFGVARMSYPTEWMMTVDVRKEPPLPQPGPRGLLIKSPGELETDLSVVAPEGLARMHEESFLDFVHPKGFGFIKDRRHVAGFQPHQFSRVPGPFERWTVQSIDLVSLLLHDEPVAYVTDHLPRMDQLRGAPTRPLDELEIKGIESLRRGEDLAIGETANGKRMLGALRNIRQCVFCHGGERGDLLGAFSYSLGREQR